jgi:hypothetical protein
MAWTIRSQRPASGPRQLAGREPAAGTPLGPGWFEIVPGESRPLIVERLSTALATLSAAGHDWRREQAAAFQAEQVSINRIAALFGVTRQRISALLKETGAGA